ncbi:TauD/TfdA dioxygenase family protein [Prauserella endophytica]|uniref:TauD/TfdA family dioxygenase n=1 Tax=Prauserella endophytica TaxID=1592324 RepID=A0ABY2S6I0_9PSEU|nr:TauD/TfdA family dioxygenase [Prauserella endophytica]PXY33326.1 taurine catabolism dioxygenase TauD [Prauserella coralliicola]TKG70904.1 TauD/TfdA family dioxygenase [Prauserella endophytica]
MGSTVTELTPTTGVEITGLSGAKLVDRGVADECLAALDRRGVVVFREAGVDDDQLVAFSRLLGEVVPLPMGGDKAHPEIQRITRDPAKSKLAAYREATFFWHIDGTTDEVPNKATVLTARQVSDDGGGDTEFANTFAAYEALPAAEKAELEGLRVVHSFAASQLLVQPNPSPKERAAWDRNPTREHPLVWTRRNGRKSLLVGATAGEVVGREPAEGKALLDRLLTWATQPKFVLRHRWRPGDLVVWDNTGMLHRALPYSATSARLMHRTSLAGEEKVA